MFNPRPLDDEEEQASLLEEIIASRWFHGTGAEIRIRILRYLFVHRQDQEGIKAITIGLDVLCSAEQKSGSRKIDALKLADTTRHQLETLRDSLIQYNLRSRPDQKWCCELEPGTSHGGHKLRFTNQHEQPRVTLGFWSGHIKAAAKNVTVCNAPLFYRDPAKHMVFRFVDINKDETDSGTALAALERDHPDLYNEGVYVSHLYLLRGEIEARDCIQEWFYNNAHIQIRKGVSHMMQQSDIDESSPILLGNPRTNQFIREIFKNDSQLLQIRMNPGAFGTVALHHSTLKKASDEEKRLLSRKPAILLQRNGKVISLPDQPPRDRERDVFAVVTRIPNPSDEGVVTMLSTDHTRVLGQVARTLTQDERLTEVLIQMNWPIGKPAPLSFQGLFVVRLRGADALKPELLAWRVYDE